LDISSEHLGWTGELSGNWRYENNIEDPSRRYRVKDSLQAPIVLEEPDFL
jgi:hypothetical protein